MLLYGFKLMICDFQETSFFSKFHNFITKERLRTNFQISK